MKSLSNKEWEEDLRYRFAHTEITGNSLPNGNIGVNLESIADVFIKEFNARHAELQQQIEDMKCCGNCNTQACCKMPHNADGCCPEWQSDGLTRERRGDMKVHKPIGFKSYDGDISFEQLCSCGYHTPHDINFLDHIEKNTVKPLSEMSHEEKCREFAELNNIHWHEVWSQKATTFEGEPVTLKGVTCVICGKEEQNLTFSDAKSILEVMMKRKDWDTFACKYFTTIGNQSGYFLYAADLRYTMKPTLLIDACLEWSWEHRLEGV